ncbi:MAG TPA: HD domain-containing protein [Anaeromyxobacteraceae bacterium]|nr:HD domain-containing protein [Anaeromyxobacteraceae bacterium]
MDDLGQAQSTLGRALARARAGEDRELAAAVRERGEQLAHLLAGLLKMSRVHAADNRAFDAPVTELAKAIAALSELLGAVVLVTVEDQVYVNDVRIRTEGKGSARELGAELGKHEVGGMTFHAPLTGPQVRSLVAALAARPAETFARAALRQALAALGLRAVEVEGRFRFRTEAERAAGAGEAVQRGLSLLARTWENLASGRVLNSLPLRRVVVDLASAPPDATELWEIPADVPPHAAHAMTVATTALALGRAAGFGEGALQDLGLAALLHDAGYAFAAEGQAAAAGRRHGGDGARLLLRQRGFHEARLRRIRALLEHHTDFAGTAHPSAFGAVLRVCEDYASFVRLHGARVTRAAVLGAMLGAAGTAYHPALPQLLVNALGQHPPGTLLELEDGRWARSASAARNAATWATPLARLLDPRTRAADGKVVDLARGPRIRRAVAG